MRIEVGQIVKVNYTSGEMKVLSLIRGCTCPHILDEINARPHMGEEAKPLPPHLHLVLRHTEKSPAHLRGEQAFLGYYDEETLRSYGEGGKFTRDRIILCENPTPIQGSIDFGIVHSIAH